MENKNEVIWSKKYNKWIAITEIHPKHEGLTKFGDKWWYDFKKDKLIHIDIVDSYIANTVGKMKSIKRNAYLTKNMIQKIEESQSNKKIMEIGRMRLKNLDPRESSF